MNSMGMNVECKLNVLLFVFFDILFPMIGYFKSWSPSLVPLQILPKMSVDVLRDF